jgi:methylenetetrahydrofolate dehydrogenase (NADP+) / methenyltetrahydrofolate cyclohydrolase
MATRSLKILSGKPSAEYHEGLIRKKLDELSKAESKALKLSIATVQVGDSAAAGVFAAHLGKRFAKFGIGHIDKRLSADQKKLEGELVSLYKDPAINGIVVFQPIPPGVNAQKIFLGMPLDKDIEGRTFLKRNPFGVFSPTAKAVMALLHHLERSDPKFKILGKHAVMVGHSDIVGKPTAALLLDAGATVTVCHKDTQDLQKHLSDADILVVAIGKANFIQGSWVKPGVVIIDVGENVVNGHVTGDVDFESASEAASYISPVPGGVGPLTTLMVIENLLTLYEYKKTHSER